MLRILVFAFGLACCAGGIYLIVAEPRALIDGCVALVIGVLIAGGMFWEPRYRTAIAPPHTKWQTTGEKFIDPVTSKLVEVDYDPKTGERRYRDAE
jgi:hypothetical protein